jgi:branched-chain amino acid transport system ATP-binding protein
MESRSILELKDISKYFYGLEALKKVSFQVDKGSITALIGPNGAGKSTAFNLISGLEKPTSGQIYFLGKEITHIEAYDRGPMGLGRIFQTPKIFDYLTVLENVMVGLHGRTHAGILKSGFRLAGFKKEENVIREEAIEHLVFMGLDGEEDRMAGTLSFGQLRLLEFARALASNPKLILLDEPTAGLTPVETEAFAEKLFVIQKNGITILIVEHDLKFIMSIAEKIIVLNHGEKIYDGAPTAIREDRQVIEAYIGTRKEKRIHAENK